MKHHIAIMRRITSKDELRFRWVCECGKNGRNIVNRDNALKAGRIHEATSRADEERSF